MIKIIFLVFYVISFSVPKIQKNIFFSFTLIKKKKNPSVRLFSLSLHLIIIMSYVFNFKDVQVL